MLSQPLSRRLRCETGAPIAKIYLSSTGRSACSDNPPTSPPNLCEGDLWGDKRTEQARFSGPSPSLPFKTTLPNPSHEGRALPLSPPSPGRERGSPRERINFANLSVYQPFLRSNSWPLSFLLAQFPVSFFPAPLLKLCVNTTLNH